MKRKITIIILSILIPFLHLHAQNKPATNEIFDGNHLYNDVKTYVDFDIHRTGTEGDNKTSAWVKNILDKAGFTTTYLSFPVNQFLPKNTFIKAGNKVIDVFPMWPVKDPNVTLTAPLINVSEHPEVDVKGKIALLTFDIADNKAEQSIKSVIASGAKAVVIDYANPAGEIAAVNTMPETSWDVPVVQIAPKDVSSLKDASTITLTITGSLKEVQARNVVGTIGSGPQFVVISTPLSGWFTCGGERGPGIAVFLALARWLGTQKNLPYTFILTANSGHELKDHSGAHIFLQNKAPKPHDVKLWLHLGASFATFAYKKNENGVTPLPVVDTNRIVFYSNEFSNSIDTIFKNIAIKKMPGKAFGELQPVYRAGYTKYIGFVSPNTFPLFHTPIDDAASTSPALLQEIATAIQKTIQKELF